MRILLRYLMRELAAPLGVWLAFLFLLLVVMQFLRGTDVLLGSAVTAPDMARLLFYLTPHFLVMALPIAFLLAILLGLGRLAEDRELVAFSALGVGPGQVVVVPVIGGALLGGLVFLLACTGEPWGLRMLKVAANELIKKNVVGDVKPGLFYDDVEKLTLYAEKVDAKGWTNVLVHDDRDPAAPLLVLARSARVDPAAGEALQLQLSNGHLHRPSLSAADYTVIAFERGEINIGLDGATHTKRRHFQSPKEELTPRELLTAAHEAEERGEDPLPFRMYFHWRLAQALSPMVFALVGAPLAMVGRRGGRARAFLLTIGAYIGYYVLTRLCEDQAMHGRIAAHAAAQLPNLVYGALGALALWWAGRSGTAR